MSENVDAAPAGAPSGTGSGQTEIWSGAPSRPAQLSSVLALAVAVVAVPLVIVGVLLFALLPGPWWLGLLLGLAAAGGIVWTRLRRADEVVLRTLSPLVQASSGSERLINMVEGLTLAGGVVPPEVHVLEDSARNGLALRRDDSNHLIFTRGLIESLDVVELEGAVAELLSRLRNGDAEAATIGAALFGQPILDGPLSSVLAPVAHFGMSRLLDDDRDIEADRQAVSLTRYPPGLHRALATLAKGNPRPASLTAGTAHLWLAATEESGSTGHRAPLALRMDVLAEL